MDFIKEWTFSICLTLIVSVIFSMLSPKGSMGKYFKIILSVFIFISFVYPLKNGDININLPEFDTSYLEDENERAYVDLITQSIENTLVDGGYELCSVQSSIDMNSNEIIINKVLIQIPDSYNDADVKSYVYDSLGIVAEVHYVGE